MSAGKAPVERGGIDELKEQLGRFLLVGIAATSVHYVVALLSANAINLYSANLLGYLAAVTVSYFGHQRYSFRLGTDAVSHRKQMPRFIAGSLSGLVLSYAVLAIMRDLLGAANWLSLAAAAGLVPVYAFFFNKLYVFRNPPRAAP